MSSVTRVTVPCTPGSFCSAVTWAGDQLPPSSSVAPAARENACVAKPGSASGPGAKTVPASIETGPGRYVLPVDSVSLPVPFLTKPPDVAPSGASIGLPSVTSKSCVSNTRPPSPTYRRPSAPKKVPARDVWITPPLQVNVLSAPSSCT